MFNLNKEINPKNINLIKKYIILDPILTYHGFLRERVSMLLLFYIKYFHKKNLLLINCLLLTPFRIF